MSVRKRVWRNSKGEILNAWVCDYSDQNGKRHLKSFKRKKDATDFKATATVEIRHGIHTPDSQSPTVSEAAAVWLENCEAEGLKRATLAQYRQHVDLHIKPYLGQTKLSRLPTSLVCDFRDKLRRGVLRQERRQVVHGQLH
jgi:integrase